MVSRWLDPAEARALRSRLRMGEAFECGLEEEMLIENRWGGER